MKKVYMILLFIVSFSFCGCKFFSSLFGSDDDELVTQTVYTQTNGDVYLVKLNNSKSIIKGENTGYVTEVSRSADQSEKDYYDTDAYIRDLNNRLNKGLTDYASNSARSAGLLGNVVSGYNNDYSVPRTFNSYVKIQNEVNISGQVRAEKKYEGNHCCVYADKNNSSASGTKKGINLTDDDYIALKDQFDAIYELETSIIGNPLYSSYNDKFYVPCNEKIIILVSDLFGDASPNQQTGTVGYFYSGDLYNQTFLDNTAGLNKGLSSSDVNYIHSNTCEMFYIDALFLTNMKNTVYSTLVHEFNHMINYVVKTLKPMNNSNSVNDIRTCATWFTEMLAMTTEDMFQKKLDILDQDSPKNRLPYFGLGYYYGFRSWDDTKIDPLIMYANTYAFGAFLARNFGGINLIKQIAQNNYVNEEAITKALQTLYPNQGYDFTYALRKFTLCVVNTDYNKDYTLNRSTGLNSDKLGFTAVNIKETIQYNGKTYNIPLIFKSGEDGQLDLYPYGFTVHYVDTNISSFEVLASTDDSLEYYCVEK